MKPRMEIRFYPGHYAPPCCMSMDISDFLIKEARQTIDYPKPDADLAIKMICTHPNVIKAVEYNRKALTESIIAATKVMLQEILSSADTVQGYTGDTNV